MIKAVLFDFNGVLLKDRVWHENAWNKLAEKVIGRKLEKTEVEEHIHGRSPNDTLSYLMSHSEENHNFDRLLQEKEVLYQKIALSKGKKFKLAEGAIELFKLLEKNGIKKTIATSSPLFHLKFYYKNLDLEKWFPFKDIVYDNGSFPGKPAPDIYLKAAKNLNVDIVSCLVVEDALSGVESATKAGAGKIIYIADNSLGIPKEVYKIIKSLKQINSRDLD